ncbi:MAG: CHAD domain-containing protein [Gammaproteobacteria bacterium]|nr:CHAD domain-containing protein [Gammaproteobacteria bacterium]
MSGSRLYQNYDKHLTTFKGYADKIEKRPDVEDIHQLRVAIKKIRTNLSLMQVASCGDFQKKAHFTLFSKLFNCAGELREIQVNRALLTILELEESYPEEITQLAVQHYKDHLSSKAEKSVSRFNRTLSNFNFRRLKKLNRELNEKITGLDDELIVDKANQFIEKQIEKIVRLRPLIDGDRELHKVRKHLKSITEIYRLLIELFADEDLKKRVERFKLLGRLIGEWHDLTVLISSMNCYAGSKEGIRFGPSLIMMETDIAMRSQKIKGEVSSHLDDIFR